MGGIIISNDDGGIGNKVVEVSFDNFTTIHGRLLKGQQLTMDTLRRSSIQIRAIGLGASSRNYSLTVWG